MNHSIMTVGVFQLYIAYPLPVHSMCAMVCEITAWLGRHGSISCNNSLMSWLLIIMLHVVHVYRYMYIHVMCIQVHVCSVYVFCAV